MTVAMLSGCNQVRPQPENLQSLSGVLVRDGGQLWFQPCYERNWWPVRDFTRAEELAGLYNQFTGLTDQPVYMELDLEHGSQADPALNIYQIKVAGGSAATCYFSLGDVEFRAASSSPYWVADLGAERVVVKSVNPVAQYNFAIDKQENGSGNTIYRERNPQKKPFRIKISRARCVDPVNGTLLDYKARMELFGQPYSGCARGANNNIQPVTGYYWTGIGEDVLSEQVLLRLGASGRADMVNRKPGAETVTVRGNWQLLKSGKLILTMKKNAGKEFLLFFMRQKDGTLKLESTSTPFGAKGSLFRYWLPKDIPGGQLSRKFTPVQKDPASGQLSSVHSAAPNGELEKVTDAIGFKVVPALKDQVLPEIIVTE